MTGAIPDGTGQVNGRFTAILGESVKRDCFVAVAPRNDSAIFFSVIASEAKQSQALWFHRELLVDKGLS
jgi:hypothetical protein